MGNWSLGMRQAMREHAAALAKHPPQKKRRKRKGKKNKPVAPQPLKNAKWMPYKEYLQTAWWKHRRMVAFRRAGWKCNRCKSSKKLQVHHRSYERLGHERHRDLEVLCRVCHEGEHEGLIAADSHLDAIARE